MDLNILCPMPEQRRNADDMGLPPVAGAPELQPTEARCAVAEGSVSEKRPLEIAISGYMNDRQDLIAAMSDVNLYYDSHAKKQEWISQELERIDKAVAGLLLLNNRNLPADE